MRKLLIAAVALGGIVSATGGAMAQPYDRHDGYREGGRHAYTEARHDGYYAQHRYWHHRHWEHGHYRYWD